MEHKKTLEMINLYFDGELNKEDEAYLFSSISSNEEGREYFKTMTTLKESHRISEKGYPQTLEEKILKGISFNQEAKSKLPERYFFIPKKVVYAFTTIIILFTFFIYSEYSINQEKIKMHAEQVEQQTEMINLLMNSLPQAEVRGVEAKKVIVRARLGVKL